MEKSSRRVFVQRLGAFALMPLARTEPDLILYNGNIWTVEAVKIRLLDLLVENSPGCATENVRLRRGGNAAGREQLLVARERQVELVLERAQLHQHRRRDVALGERHGGRLGGGRGGQDQGEQDGSKPHQ